VGSLREQGGGGRGGARARRKVLFGLWKAGDLGLGLNIRWDWALDLDSGLCTLGSAAQW